MKRLMQAFRRWTQRRTSVEEARLGLESPVYLDVPAAFFHEASAGADILIRPRKDGGEAPVSLRMTWMRDLSDVLNTADELEELLLKLNPGSKLMGFGSNVLSMQHREDTDGEGASWLQLHHAIYVSGMLCTATISILKGRGTDPEVGELRDAMPEIFKSMRVK